MDRAPVLFLNFLDLLGVLATMEVLVSVWNAFGDMSSAPVHKEI